MGTAKGGVSGACLALVLTAALPAAAAAQTQNCYARSGFLRDLCGEPQEEQYVYNGSVRNAEVRIGSTSYLLYGYPNSLDVFNVTTPMSPVKLKDQLQLPWLPDPGSSTHEGLVDHLRKFAVLDDFPYAFVGLYTYGWDFFDVANQRWLKLGLQPKKVMPAGGGYSAGALFRGSDGRVYLAAQKLDQGSVSAGDNSIQLYDVTTPASYKVMQPVVTVPVGRAGDTPPYNTFSLETLGLDVFHFGGRTYLAVRDLHFGGGRVIVDVTNPSDVLSGVTPVAMWTSASVSDTRLFEGAWAFDGKRGRLYAGTSNDALIYVFDTSNLASGAAPAYRSTVRWWGTSPTGQLPAASLSLKDDLLVVWAGYIGYLSLQGTGDPLKLDDADDVTTLTRVCTGPFVPSPQTLSPFTVPGDPQYAYVARSLYVYGDILQIHQACMSTTPNPNLTVSPTNANACNPVSATVAGFPGDTFTITNTSGGVWANPILYYTPPGGSLQSLANPMPNPTTWPSSANGPAGTYSFDLTITDKTGTTPYSTSGNGNTKTVYLCPTPQAAARITQVNGADCQAGCAYITGDTVTVSAAAPGISQGHPGDYSWIIKDQQNNPVLPASIAPDHSSITVLLSQPGSYSVFVAVKYQFQPTLTGDDAKCLNPVYSALNLSTNNAYDSCTDATQPLTLLSEPFSVGQITVSDGPTSATSTSSPTPTLLKGNPITFSATYRVATSYTPTFLWGFENASTPPAPNPPDTTSTPGTVKGFIPAGTLAVGGPYTASLLQATATSGTNPVDLTSTISAVPFNVTDCTAPGQATPTSPANGASLGTAPVSVTFSWSAPATGTPPYAYEVKDPSGMVTYCTASGGTSCTYTASVAGTYTWTVFAHSVCGSGVSQSATFSFTVTGSSPPPPPPPTCTGLTVTPNKNPANVGDAVIFTFSPRLSQNGDSLTFTFGDGQSQTIPYDSLCQVVGCDTVSHTYQTAGTFTVKGTGQAGGRSVCGTRTETVQNNCQLPSAPTAAFAFNPLQPLPNQAIQFTDQSTGNPTAWSWDFGDGIGGMIAGGSSNAQHPTYKYKAPGTYTVTLTATNCRGSSQKQLQVTVQPQCSVTEPPVADFTWAPTGVLPAFPEQQQPYVGQQVTLTDHSTNNPFSWHWYDFQEGAVDSTVTSPTFTFTWHEQGPKNVRMTATNCIGGSAEVLKTIQVYDDVRHVVADFTWSPEAPETGVPVTLVAAQGPSYGDPDDFTWTFDDGTPSQTGSSVTHSFACGGDQKVTLTARRGGHSATARKMVPVAGKACGPESVMAVDAAKLNGLNGTSWRTDVRIFNPGEDPSRVWLEFLPVGKNNVTPFKAGPYTINAKATLVLNNILDWVATTLGQDFNKTALRVTYDTGDEAPVVIARTYTPSPSGGTYGQFAPGIAVVPNTTPSPLWITGLRNNGLAEGFRTNYSLVNLRDDAGGVSNIRFTLFDAAGTPQDTKVLGLAPYGYLQDSVKNLFGGKFENIGNFSLKIDVPSDADIQAYASVMDNKTGDPVLIPAVQAADSVIYLPAVAHLSGEAGTLWRTDLQLTNPDTNSAHVWEVEFTPKGTNLPIVAQNVTLAPNQSLFTDNLVVAIYGPTLPADAQTSGVVRISMGPGDSSNALPIVAARSYNLTPSGTFGQSIMPLWAAKGISADSQNKRLLITGMSSEDIARTNLAFVSLSDTQGVDFSVLLYGESGSLLNPQDMVGTPTPYTFAIGPGGWDQDKLENRFRRAFKAELPANQRSISAVITIRGGGPGFVYATVIDNLTGDPNFIPAQPAP